MGILTFCEMSSLRIRQEFSVKQSISPEGQQWTEAAARGAFNMLTSDLTSLVPPQFSPWLQVRKLAPFIFHLSSFIYSESKSTKPYFA